MKTKFLLIITAVALLSFPKMNFGQAPDLGTLSGFVLFSTNGPISNTGISQVTGNVGTNNGSNTAFGNVNGVMHEADDTTAKCAIDLLAAYTFLTSATPDYHPSALLGNGDTLLAGVHNIAGAATLNLNLYLDAKGDPNAVFIFQLGAALSTAADSKVILVNGALACNVFWAAGGLVDMTAGTEFRGTLIANNSAVHLNANGILEGRLFTTTGAITISGVLAYVPIGCGSPVLNGPTAPNLLSTGCYAIFSGAGAVSNSGISIIKGDVGTNVGLTTGFNSLDVTGTIHPGPDGSTATCAADLTTVYTYMNLMAYDIELLHPEQLGNNLVLTPHTYRMKAAAAFTDTLFLDAQDNANATFVIQIDGALTAGANSNVVLKNGAQAKNVYWKIEGAANIATNSVFCGTMICNNGALGVISTGVKLDGRILTTVGALSTAAVTVTIVNGCGTTGVETLSGAKDDAITVFPNPFNTSTTIEINNSLEIKNCELRIYNVLGEEMMNTRITKPLTTLETSNLPSGIYFYTMISNNTIVQTGRMVSQQ